MSVNSYVLSALASTYVANPQMLEAPHLWIYDENFEGLGFLMAYSELRWNRRFNDMPTFEIKTPFQIEMFDLLAPHRIIYRHDIKEAMIILDRIVYTGADGQPKLIIRGEGLEWQLYNRVATLTTNASVSSIFTQLINNYFINPSNTERKVASFILGNTTLKNNTPVAVDYQQDTFLFDIIMKITKEKTLGFSVDFDIYNKKYVFNLHDSKPTEGVVFSREWKNIVEQDVINKTSNYKNVAYVNGVQVGSVSGFWRQETSVSYVTGESEYVTGSRELTKLQKVNSVNIRIDQSSPQFIYLTDYDIGSIIKFKDYDLNMELEQVILEIDEFYELGKFNLNVIFGDYIW